MISGTGPSMTMPLEWVTEGAFYSEKNGKTLGK